MSTEVDLSEVIVEISACSSSSYFATGSENPHFLTYSILFYYILSSLGFISRAEEATAPLIYAIISVYLNFNVAPYFQ